MKKYVWRRKAKKASIYHNLNIFFLTIDTFFYWYDWLHKKSSFWNLNNHMNTCYLLLYLIITYYLLILLFTLTSVYIGVFVFYFMGLFMAILTSKLKAKLPCRFYCCNICVGNIYGHVAYSRDYSDDPKRSIPNGSSLTEFLRRFCEF